MISQERKAEGTPYAYPGQTSDGSCKAGRRTALAPLFSPNGCAMRKARTLLACVTPLQATISLLWASIAEYIVGLLLNDKVRAASLFWQRTVTAHPIVAILFILRKSGPGAAELLDLCSVQRMVTAATQALHRPYSAPGRGVSVIWTLKRTPPALAPSASGTLFTPNSVPGPASMKVHLATCTLWFLNRLHQQGSGSRARLPSLLLIFSTEWPAHLPDVGPEEQGVGPHGRPHHAHMRLLEPQACHGWPALPPSATAQRANLSQSHQGSLRGDSSWVGSTPDGRGQRNKRLAARRTRAPERFLFLFIVPEPRSAPSGAAGRRSAPRAAQFLPGRLLVFDRWSSDRELEAAQTERVRAGGPGQARGGPCRAPAGTRAARGASRRWGTCCWKTHCWSAARASRRSWRTPRPRRPRPRLGWQQRAAPSTQPCRNLNAAQVCYEPVRVCHALDRCLRAGQASTMNHALRCKHCQVVEVLRIHGM